jgi:sulfoxide reductase heme-binding subunit YedZ
VTAAVAVASHLMWVTSRAGGMAALFASSASVGLGIAMVLRLGPRLGDTKVVHEALALATIVALLVHGLALMGDGYLRASLVDVAVPFVGPYRPLWNGIGIIGGWGLITFGLGHYARHRIAPDRWRQLHRLTAVAWLLGVVHSFGTGSDAHREWFLIFSGVVVAPAGILIARRVLRGTRRPAASSPNAVRARRARFEPGPAEAG